MIVPEREGAGMHGVMVVNGFLQSGKFTEIYEWLSVAAHRQGISLSVQTNAQIPARADCAEILNNGLLKDADFILFWDKDVFLARTLEAAGFRLFNCADAIGACDHKAETFFRLRGSGIRMPQTILIPQTFHNIGYTELSFLEDIENQLKYPFVMKECFGSFGAQVYLAGNHEDAVDILKKTEGRPVICQEFIKESAGRDIRINMVGGRAVATMMREHDSDFRANVTNGGKMKKYSPTLEQIRMAEKVCSLLKLDFGGVDILFGTDGEPVLCEVNSNAHFKNIFDCTGINVADAIMEHIREEIH